MNLIELRRFVDDYNAFGMGKAEVYETSYNFVLRFYNAGFSENEEMEHELKKNRITWLDKIYDRHPVTIYVINKLQADFFFQIPKEELILLQEIAVKLETFIYRIEVD